MKNLLEHKALQVEVTPGKVIRAFRQNFGLTLDEISKATGIPASNISAIENDRLDIGIKRALLIAAVFGIHPALILFPEGYEEREDELDLKRVRKIGAALIEKKRKAG